MTRPFIAIIASAALLGCQGDVTDEPTPEAVTQSQQPVEPAPAPPQYSDGDLANCVKAAIDAHTLSEWSPPRDLTVSADQGVVTLRGSVISSIDKAAVESAARGVDGVQRVQSRLVVGTARPN